MPERELAPNMSFRFVYILAALLLASLSNKTINCGGEYSEPPQCNNVIAVDRTRGESCSNVSLLQRALSVCSNLQEVLISLSSSNEGNSNCTEIVLSEGTYLIEGDTNIIINHNVYLHSNESNMASIELQASVSASNSLQFKFAIQFRDSLFAIIRSIHFTGSKSGVIGFDNVSHVRIFQSTFRYFTQGAVDIYNCHTILVMQCIFESNGPVTITKTDPWRGHSGGLSIAYNYNQPLNGTIISATIANNTFANNSAKPLSKNKKTTTQVLTQFVFTGRGGGCAININSVTRVNVTVKDCIFTNNYALNYAGGLYLAFRYVSGHIATVSESEFIENQTPGGAGGMEIGFVSGGRDAIANKVFALRLLFRKNNALFGSGTNIFVGDRSTSEGEIGNLVRFEDCRFESNSAMLFGGAVGMIIPSVNITFGDRGKLNPVQFESCEFISNDGGQGAIVSSSYLPATFTGKNVFRMNKGVCLSVVGSVVRFQGKLHFMDNEVAGDGGAIYAISMSQILLAKETELIFKNNIGNLGAAIVVNTLYIPPLFSRLIHNPLCVFLVEDRVAPLNGYNESFLYNITVYLSGNRAVVGSGVFTNNIHSCSWTGTLKGDGVYFDPKMAFRWKSFKYINNNQNSAHFPDDLNPKWYVQTQEESMRIRSNNFSAYPGEKINIDVEAMDQLNHSTVSILRLSDKDTFAAGDRSQDILLSPSVISLNQGRDSGGVNVTVFIRSRSVLNTTKSVKIEADSSESVKFSLAMSECPPGYTLWRDVVGPGLYSCLCDYHNEAIVDCDGGERIQLRDGYWASSSTLFAYPCPDKFCRCATVTEDTVRHYCSNILNTSDPDSQCTCDRYGILCGSCRGDRGYSAILSHCVTCSRKAVAWIAALFWLDVLVYVGLLLLSMQFPSYLIPCVCYLQVLPIIAEFFPRSFESAHDPLRIIISASSFYFVYDFCLGPTMDPRLLYFIRYMPLFAALVTCPVVIWMLRIGQEYYVMISRWRRFHGVKLLELYKSGWSGLWWIINLIYIHTVQTSMTILTCPNIHVDKDTYSLRWAVSGDIECFRGSHSALALLAILILVICALLVPAIAALSIVKGNRFQRLVKPLTLPYKVEYKWWLAVEFSKRFLLLFFISAFPRNNYPTMMFLAIVIVVHGFLMPYTNTITNIMETLLSVNVLILLLLNTIESQELAYASTRNVDSSVCEPYMGGLSPFSYILLIFYYFPLLVTVVGIGSWISLSIKPFIGSKTSGMGVDDVSTYDVMDRSITVPTTSEVTL